MPALAAFLTNVKSSLFLNSLIWLSFGAAQVRSPPHQNPTPTKAVNTSTRLKTTPSPKKKWFEPRGNDEPATSTAGDNFRSVIAWQPAVAEELLRSDRTCNRCKRHARTIPTGGLR